jgi:hypothetical protein
VLVLLTAVIAPALQIGFMLAIVLGAHRRTPAKMGREAVVVLTMLAVESFDPRLIWDATSSEEVRYV